MGNGLGAPNPGDDALQAMLAPWAVVGPVDGIARVQAPLRVTELAWLPVSVARGHPFGEQEWMERAASELSLGPSVRPAGRPPQPRT